MTTVVTTPLKELTNHIGASVELILFTSKVVVLIIRV